MAIVVYALALTPHVLWLIKWHFPTLQWATSLAEQPGSLRQTLDYLGHHFALIAIPVVVGAALLARWRMRPRDAVAHRPDALLVLIISAVLVFTPVIAALALGSYLRLDWGNP